MRFLHTADWHVGKKLGRIDRRREFEAVLDELVAIVRDQKIDAVLVSGDLLDRAFPPLDSISLMIDTLLRLAGTGAKVIAIPGNHDSPALFQMLAPLLAPAGIFLVPRIVRADEGGIVRVFSREGAEEACIGAFPFLHEAQVVDFMKESEEWFKGYAHRVRLLGRALCEGFDADGIGILMGHYFVEGAEVGGGERRIHLGQQYAATAQSIPPGASYVALGHIHRPQSIEGSAVPARYAGSLLQLDFSERTHNKEVVVVDVKRAMPPKVTRIQLKSGRKLVRVEDDLEALQRRSEEFKDSYLDVRVKTSGPVFGLFEEVRRFLPNAVLVQAVYERTGELSAAGHGPGDAALADLYAGYHSSAYKVEPPQELLDIMRSLEDELHSQGSLH